MKSSRSRNVWLALWIFFFAGAISQAATFTVTNILATGPGSISNAIVQANVSPGLDTIAFDIPGPGVRMILVTNALPSVTNSVIIDGYTQPGSSPNTLADGINAVLLIELKGGGAAVNIDGLVFTGGGINCTVRGLIMNGGFGGASGIDGAIKFAYATAVNSSNVVEGCFLGTDPTGTTAAGNLNGVVTFRSSGNRIGGTTPAARNLISGNSGAIRFTLGSSNNSCANSFTDLPPAIALPGVGDVFTNRLHVSGATNRAGFYRVRLVQ